MPRITKVYTKTGDDGTTGLGSGRRVPKDSPRVAAYGTVDELNSAIGCAIACGLNADLDRALLEIQNELFHLGSDLCILEEDKKTLAGPRIESRHVEALEKLMDRLTESLAPLENFILPGGTSGAAMLHLARTICRRAEREVFALGRKEPVGPFVIPYLNRLSDTLFVMARFENKQKGRPDVYWNSRK
jgi:cob(I)alamin adenosyltransferase